jgi:hypothetical protein
VETATTEDQLLDADEHGEQPDFHGYSYAAIHQEWQLQKERVPFFF